MFKVKKLSEIKAWKAGRRDIGSGAAPCFGQAVQINPRTLHGQLCTQHLTSAWSKFFDSASRAVATGATRGRDGSIRSLAGRPGRADHKSSMDATSRQTAFRPLPPVPRSGPRPGSRLMLVETPGARNHRVESYAMPHRSRDHVSPRRNARRSTRAGPERGATEQPATGNRRPQSATATRNQQWTNSHLAWLE